MPSSEIFHFFNQDLRKLRLRVQSPTTLFDEFVSAKWLSCDAFATSAREK